MVPAPFLEANDLPSTAIDCDRFIGLWHGPSRAPLSGIWFIVCQNDRAWQCPDLRWRYLSLADYLLHCRIAVLQHKQNQVMSPQFDTLQVLYYRSGVGPMSSRHAIFFGVQYLVYQDAKS
jgi:hypothetical protein